MTRPSLMSQIMAANGPAQTPAWCWFVLGSMIGAFGGFAATLRLVA